jgi:LysR family glycine cleavage system transcriptional activator
VRAAEQGMGAALVPVPVGNAWFESGALVRLFDKDLVADVSYYLVYHKDRARDASVSLLRDWILANFT